MYMAVFKIFASKTLFDCELVKGFLDRKGKIPGKGALKKFNGNGKDIILQETNFFGFQEG